jgi:hypothetical protein
VFSSMIQVDTRHAQRWRCRTIALVIACLASVECAAAEGAPAPAPDPAIATAATATGPGDDIVPVELNFTADENLRLRWFFFAGIVNAYPYMKSEKLIRNIYDPVMRAIAPGHDDVHTVGELRDDNLLLPPQFGLGYNLSKRFVLSVQGGWAAGTIRTQQDNASIFLFVPWHEDFSIRRGAGYIGGGLDFYPFGTVETRKYDGFVDRLKHLRPFVGASVTATHATYNARVQIGLRGLPNIGIKLSDAWLLPSLNVHYGIDFPINDNSQMSVNLGFNHFWEEEDDFEGWALSWTYKYFFH